MAQYFELHSQNPQLRLIRRAAEIVRNGGLIAYPTDSCYALGCHIGKAATPGPFTFLLPATRETPRRLQHPKRRTIGIRVPDHPVPQMLLAELAEPVMSSTLLLPGDELPLTDGDQIRARLEHQLDAILDGGHCGIEPTTVIDLAVSPPVLVRAGKGKLAGVGWEVLGNPV